MDSVIAAIARKTDGSSASSGCRQTSVGRMETADDPRATARDPAFMASNTIAALSALVFRMTTSPDDHRKSCWANTCVRDVLHFFNIRPLNNLR
ncbi:hypothetical protein [Agrobacterium tumefaciens]|uniref:hypothetical protein n=1 Tax=Agrobacterium tumefaciens TaxID=358 RepID=UPI003B9EB767